MRLTLSCGQADMAKLQSHMELHNWQMTFEENRAKDHEEIMGSLTRIEDMVTVQTEVQNRSSAEISQMMFMMQNVSLLAGVFRNSLQLKRSSS